MFDIGWSEMLMLAVLAVIIVGPKDLPQVLRVVGKWVAKARGMAREFQSGLEDIAREAELDQLKNQVNKAAAEFEKTAAETENEVRNSTELHSALDPTGTSDDAFSIGDSAAQDSGKQGLSEQPDAASDSGEASDEWAERYASSTAPAHSVSNSSPAAADESHAGTGTPPDTADTAAKSRTGT